MGSCPAVGVSSCEVRSEKPTTPELPSLSSAKHKSHGLASIWRLCVPRARAGAECNALLSSWEKEDFGVRAMTTVPAAMTAVIGLSCCTVRPTSPLAWALASQTGYFQLLPLGVAAYEKPRRGQFSVCSLEEGYHLALLCLVSW